MPRQYAPHSPPVALTIAGSDSGGGAGIQADLKTMEAHDAFGTSVVTATTAQNTQGVEDVNVLSTDHIAAQYKAVITDFDVGAIKTGMLATEPVIQTVADCVADFAGPIVVDPVMVAATGDRLLSEAAETAYETLLGYATLVTPNVDEAEILTGREITNTSDAEQAGRHLLEVGVDAALVKGGHLDGDEVVDTLVVARDGEPHVERFSHPRIDAVADGVAFMEQAVRYGIDAGEGPGAVHHLVGVRERADRPTVSDAVESVVARLVDRNVETLVPAVGMGVVGASQFAEQPADVVGVDGRLTTTRSGIRPTAGVRTGGSPGLARELLAVRELFPEIRFGLNCRFDGSVETALETLDGPVVESSGPERETVDSLDHTTPVVRVADAAEPPAAVIDRGGEGRPAGVVVLAPDAQTLIERTLQLHDALITE